MYSKREHNYNSSRSENNNKLFDVTVGEIVDQNMRGRRNFPRVEQNTILLNFYKAATKGGTALYIKISIVSWPMRRSCNVFYILIFSMLYLFSSHLNLYLHIFIYYTCLFYLYYVYLNICMLYKF